MECKIVSIKHTGRLGVRYSDRVDGRYPLRIGRIINFDPSKIVKGRSMVIEYLKNSDGSDYSNMFLTTSFIVDFTFDNGVFIIETNNSIYEFVKL